jgi:hypothetical protein
MSLTSHHTCQAPFDIHLLTSARKLCSICQRAHSGFPSIFHHQQKINDILQKADLFFCKLADPLFVHMYQITPCIWQDIGLNSRYRKGIDGGNLCIAISCNRRGAFTTRRREILCEQPLSVAYAIWCQENCFIKTSVKTSKKTSYRIPGLKEFCSNIIFKRFFFKSGF